MGGRATSDFFPRLERESEPPAPKTPHWKSQDKTHSLRSCFSELSICSFHSSRRYQTSGLRGKKSVSLALASSTARWSKLIGNRYVGRVRLGEHALAVAVQERGHEWVVSVLPFAIGEFIPPISHSFSNSLVIIIHG